MMKNIDKIILHFEWTNIESNFIRITMIYQFLFQTFYYVNSISTISLVTISRSYWSFNFEC